MKVLSGRGIWEITVLSSIFVVLLSATGSVAQGTGRVTDGLLALYGFEEGSGTTVTDVSGVGTPLNLTIDDAAAVSWIPGGGLSVNASTLIASPAAATKVIDAVNTSEALTLEAWVKPANTTQTGPARIVTLSENTSKRNVTLGQGTTAGDDYEVRFRTTSTNNNGSPSLTTAAGTLTTNLTHVVYTRDATGDTKIYLDGVLSTQGTTSGSVSNWAEHYRLALGNELTSDRPWLGDLHVVALFDRALDATEVTQNFNAGPVITQQGPALLLLKEPTSQTVLSGGTAMFTLTVRNVGNADLFNIVLSDPDCGPVTLIDDGNGDMTLDMAETWIYTCSIPNVLNNLTNTATVTGEDASATPVSDTASGDVVVVANQRVTAGQVALYPFDEGSGTTVADLSGVGTPLNLNIDDPTAITWLPGGGLSVNASTLIASPGPGTKIIDAVQTTEELTIEAWVKPANTTQTGPARIVSLSHTTSVRNVTLGQGDGTGDHYDVRFRATSTNNNGSPSLSTAAGTLTTNLTHVVYTRQATGETKIYLDGVLTAQGTTSGSVSNWEDHFRLALGNELTGDRPWLGELHLVALFNRALTATEVTQNFNAGPVITQDGPALLLSKEPTSQTVLSGGTAMFTLTVENVGNVDLVNIALTDPDCGPVTLVDDGNGDSTLDVAETWIYTCTIPNVTTTLTNTATVTGEDASATPVSATASGQVTVVADERVTSGQVALYEFQEGSGTTVTDTSGVGTPLNLAIDDLNHVTWLQDGGLSLDASVLISSPGPGTKIIDAVDLTEEFTIEGWVTPANTNQTGPARIVTLSLNTSKRNFTLGQGTTTGDHYDVRFRATSTNGNGSPSLTTAPGTLTTNLTHVVFTRQTTGATHLYVDGVLSAQGTTAGNINWNSAYQLAMGNELTGTRPWLGELHLVALFNRALAAEEVAQNFLAGVSSANTPPVADAGPDQTVPRNTLVTLDGSGSSDPDNDPLTFNWTITSQPAGSTATLTNPTSVNPTFTPDVDGDYTIELIVNDGTEDSAPDSVVITAENTQPVADAGPDQTVPKGATVQLDGSGSSDANSDPLTFQWSLIQQPASSTATLSDPNIVNPTFDADEEGTYVAQLIVNDSFVDSAPDTVTITVVNDPPVLDPVGSQTVNLGQTLTLTLTGSDPNGDAITFSATPLPLPPNLTINSSTGVVTFTPDATQVGTLNLTLLVSDGMLTDSETITITTQQVAPPSGTTELTGRILDTTDFVATGTETPVVGATVSILGSGSTTISDAQGFFTLTNMPAGNQVFDIDASTANPAPDSSTYAGFREQLEVMADVTNVVERPFFLPRIDPAGVATVDPNATTVVTNPNIGVTITVPPHTAKNPDGTDFTGQLSVSEVPAALAPAALPEELNPSLLITIQPVGVVFDPPVAITFPNTDNMDDDNEVNIWSLEAGTGTFIPVGVGRVEGAEVNTISGGVRAADWHFLTGLIFNLAQPNTPKNKKPKNCEKQRNSRIPICSGELIEEHQLVSYRSLEVNRAPKLIYRSESAAPQPIIATNPSLFQRSQVPDLLSTKIEIGGVQQGAEVFTDTSVLSEFGTETIRQAIQFDASAFSTGDYPYRLFLTNHFGFSSVSRVLGASVLIQNEQASPFGVGWTLDGLGRLHLQTDGKAVITEGNGGVVVFDRPLPGTFGAPQLLPAEEDSDLPIQIGDYNEDGKLDLAVPYNFLNSGRVQVHFGAGDGTFTGTANTTNLGTRATAIAQGDFDADGHLDLITVNELFTDQVRINFGDGAGQFSAFVFFTLSGVNPFPTGVTVGDFDNNGLPDFAIANQIARNVMVRLKLDNGIRGVAGWGPEIPTFTFTSSVAGPSDIVSADFNGDGNLDVALARNTRVTLLYGDGQGNLGANGQFKNFDGVTLALNLAVGDFNQDGWPDLAATGSTLTLGDTVYYYQNNGIGGFLPRQDLSLNPSASPDRVEAADLNADGFLDLMTANSGLGGTVSILYGDGLGNFDDPIDVPVLASTRAVSAGDLDETGTVDLITRTVEGLNEQVKIILNADPNGGFFAPAGDFSTFVQNPDNTFTRRLKDGTNIHFDTQGRQTSVMDRNGNSTTYTYDGTSDRVLTITDPVGLQTTFVYGPDDKLDTITDPANRVTTLDHDADSNLISIMDPDNTTRTFTYDTRHRMTGQTSKRGFDTTYDYNFAGRVIKATRQDGSTNLFAPSKLVGLADTANGEGTQTNPLPVVRPSEVQSTVTDARGKVTTYQLDSFGNSTLTIDPLNRTTTTTRNTDGDATSIIAPNGAVTDMAYDSRGNVLIRKEAVGTSLERQTTFTYDPNFNQVTSITDPAGNVTTIQMDANGNPEKVINPLFDERIRTFESRGLVLTDTDENGKTTTFTYDINGNIGTITDPEGNLTQFTRDGAGNVLTITEGVGTSEVRTRTFSFDVLNRLTSANDGTPAVTQFAYDAQGNLTNTTRPTGEQETRTYDPLERVTTINDPIRGITQFSYDGNDNLLLSVNELNDHTRFEYDDANQLTKITDALNGEQNFEYDLSGNVQIFTDARGKKTTFAYDILDRQTSRTNPLTEVTTFTYDPRDNLEMTTDAKSQHITRTYDDLSRITQITTPNNTIAISYDAVGNPLTVGDTDSLVTFTYDGLNRVVTEGTTDLGAQPAVTLTSSYNAVGDQVQLDDTAPGTTMYEYDLAGRLTKLTTPASQEVLLAYDSTGRLDKIVFPNGVVSDYGYDTQGRLNTLTHTLGANPSFTDFGYTYNPVGNILSILDNVTSAQTRTFTYDALQRLKTGGTTPTPETYNYDLTGNRTMSFLSTLHMHDHANRLLEDDDFTYTYDANGSLTTKTSKAVPTDVTTFIWDAQGQLIQITFPDSTTATYKYDGLGRRIEKNVNGSIVRYVYDGENIALEYDGTNTFVSRYSHGNQTDQPLAVQRAGVGFFYYQADYQGSITHLTDSSGLVANIYLYDSYGRTLTLSETVPQPFTYTGRERDAESELYYYRARYYDSQNGRFLSEDPLGLDAGDQNLYRYVLNNPVNFLDPSGENLVALGIGIGVGVAIVAAQILLFNDCMTRCTQAMKDNDDENDVSCPDPTGIGRCAPLCLQFVATLGLAADPVAGAASAAGDALGRQFTK